MMTEGKDHIDLRSEEVKDILGRVPKWLTRYGSMFVFFAIALILVVAGIVKYPDLVSAPLQITASSPPIPLYPRIAGNVEELLVENQEYVEKGQVLGILQNSANEETVFLIEAKLDSFLRNPSAVKSMYFPQNTELGRLQSVYSTFLNAINDYRFFAKENVGSASVGLIQSQINQLYNVNAGLEDQSYICRQELDLVYNSYRTNMDLLSKGIISQKIVDESQAVYYQKNAACESLKIELTNNELRIQELRTEIFGISSDNKQGDQSKNMLLNEAVNNLSSEIALWKSEYLIIAPVAGSISFNQIWSPGQYINLNQEILSIIQNEDKIKIFAQIQSKDIAKVKVGQEVNIRLEAYHFMEYGFVKGNVLSISQVPREGLYQVEISLQNGLISTYDKKLNFTQGMLGTVEIISQQRTFLSRIFDTFKYLKTKKYEE